MSADAMSERVQAVTETRGQAIERRMVALGMTPTELGRESGADRGTIKRAIDDAPNVRSTTYRAIESALDKNEVLLSADQPDTDLTSSTEAGLIEFDATIEPGMRFIVKGPVSNAEQLEQMIVRLIRDTRDVGPRRDK